MPHIADQYRRAAEEAKQLATKATDSCERVQLLRLAAQWQRLADVSSRSKTARLFDHLISGGEQRWRNVEAERFGCLEIDGQF